VRDVAILEALYAEGCDYAAIRGAHLELEPVPVALTVDGPIIRLEFGELPPELVEEVTRGHAEGSLQVSIGPTP